MDPSPGFDLRMGRDTHRVTRPPDPVYVGRRPQPPRALGTPFDDVLLFRGCRCTAEPENAVRRREAFPARAVRVGLP